MQDRAVAALATADGILKHVQNGVGGSSTRGRRPGRFQIGEIKVDTTKREASVAAKVNAVQLLEFVANTKNGMKAYESALTIETNAITFNAAMLMIGLDKDHARVPTRHFD